MMQVSMIWTPAGWEVVLWCVDATGRIVLACLEQVVVMRELLAVGLAGMWLLEGPVGHTRPSVVAGVEVAVVVVGLAVLEAVGWQAMCFLGNWRRHCCGNCSRIVLLEVAFEVERAVLVVFRPVVTGSQQEEMRPSVTMSRYAVAKATAG